MQKLIWILQNNYRCTLGRAWGVNCTTFQIVCYKIFEIFVEEETKKKISLHKEANPKDLISMFHPS